MPPSQITLRFMRGYNFCMVQYRRNFVASGTYFFTVALADRSANTLVQHIDRFRDVVAKVKCAMPFDIAAWVVLPDHCHAVWTLPDGDANYSGRWRAIKSGFVRALKSQGLAIPMRADGSAVLWQRRFWEHTVASEPDLGRCVAYCYINPVKHGLVQRVVDWPHSSFHRDVASGVFPVDWAGNANDGGLLIE